MIGSGDKRIVGVILAGGLSRRMGGGDKGMLDLGGCAMIEHVIARLASQVDAVAVNANGDPARLAFLGLPVVPDTIDGYVGPLAGVLAGMRWAQSKQPGATHIATVSADAPFLPADLVERLRAAVSEDQNAIAVACSANELHPVIGLWPVRLADDLEEALRAGIRKVLRWTDRHGTVPVAFDKIAIAGEHIDPFFNANTPEEMQEARRVLALLSI